MTGNIKFLHNIVVFVLILQLYLFSISGQLQCNNGETATPLSEILIYHTSLCCYICAEFAFVLHLLGLEQLQCNTNETGAPLFLKY